MFAGDTSIKKQIWSKSMAVTNHNWNSSLMSLYSTTSTNLLNKVLVLDTNNQLIFNSDKSRIIVNNGTTAEEITLITSIQYCQNLKKILRNVYTNVRSILSDHTATSDRVRLEVRI